MFVIQSGVEIPVSAPAGRPTVDYPFAELQVTQCFFVPVRGEETDKQVIGRVRAKALRWKKQAGLPDTTFRVTKSYNPQDGTPSVGVWRIA